MGLKYKAPIRVSRVSHHELKCHSTRVESAITGRQGTLIRVRPSILAWLGVSPLLYIEWDDKDVTEKRLTDAHTWILIDPLVDPDTRVTPISLKDIPYDDIIVGVTRVVSGKTGNFGRVMGKSIEENDRVRFTPSITIRWDRHNQDTTTWQVWLGDVFLLDTQPDPIKSEPVSQPTVNKEQPMTDQTKTIPTIRIEIVGNKHHIGTTYLAAKIHQLVKTLMPDGDVVVECLDGDIARVITDLASQDPQEMRQLPVQKVIIADNGPGSPLHALHRRATTVTPAVQTPHTPPTRPQPSVAPTEPFKTRPLTSSVSSTTSPSVDHSSTLLYVSAVSSPPSSSCRSSDSGSSYSSDSSSSSSSSDSGSSSSCD